MSLVYAWEKLYVAVDALCGHGSQKTRLAKAARDGLIQVRPDDLPVELRGEFVQLMKDLTAVHVDGKEANVQATIDTLDASAREKVIKTILIVFSSASRRIAVF